ncbi:MAG: ImmA/IrrE family metallo-endopeptidase [Methanobrevibacter sp.]|jgi:Zn-dependent peptidase ImmA (M78 family)/transcriptional regulator with XRE-family HTH domain|nr:ImmA/IrrE family metallo-endopeptidase [Candidatus Methanoflexus mossambicus]
MVSRANINPEVLKWARIDAGYDESNLPKNLLKNYQKWENGSVKPTWNQLRELANQFKRPSAFFFRKEIPVVKKTSLIEYRQKNNEFIHDKSPNLIYNIRLCENLRKNYIELMERMYSHQKSFKKYRVDFKDVTEVSNHFRNILDLDLNEQKKWFVTDSGSHDFKHYNFLNNWKIALNNIGVLVFETERVSIDEMRALAIYHDNYPIIILNGADSVNSRIFSLFHELTHLILGESAICDLEDENKKEIFCNAVSGEFLVPFEDLNKTEIKDISSNTDDNKIESILLKISNIYGVSREVILRRTLDLNKISKEYYNSKKNEWNENYKKTDKNSGGNYLNNKLKYYGKEYSSLILSAYENKIISSVEFSDFMNLSIKHVPKLEHLIFGD